MSTLFKIAKNTSLLYISHILTTITNFVVNVLLVRYLGKELFGTLSAALATVCARFIGYYSVPLIFKEARPSLTFFHNSLLLPMRMVRNILASQND